MTDIETVVNGLNDIGAGRVGIEQPRNFLRMIDDAIDLLKEQDEETQNLRRENHNILTQFHEWAKEQEAKQGKWERQYSRPGVYANLFWWCSVCGEPTRYNDAGIFYQYCPHCGAKLEACKDT